MSPTSPHSTFRFADFELNVAGYELRQKGRAVRLERLPLDLLILLVERSRELVTRNEIVQRLWGAGVFVDVETGVNTAIRKVRQALHDVPEKPVFIETVPGRGYRFIAPVQIRETTSQEPARQQVTMAVLPFENLGADPAREYLADGLTEETIAVLGQIDPEHLRVIGRTSVMTYKKTTKSLAEIGRELGAGYLVESSVRGEGGRVRITSKLIRLPEQVQIWSASFDSEPSSMLTLQRELSIAIAEQVRLRVSPERLNALKRRQTENAEAYDHYLRGRHFWNQLTPLTTRRAIEYYRRATEVDSEYALAWSGLADAYASAPINGDGRPFDVWPHARDAAAHAVAAAPNLAEAQTSLGIVNFFLEWNWPASETAYRKAIALDPGYALAHRMLGVLLSHMCRHGEAAISIRRARELDPLYAMHYALSAMLALNARDHAAGLQFARQSTIVDPEFWIGYYHLAGLHVELGNAELALEALLSAGRFSGGNSKAISLRGYVFAKLGRTEEAREVLQNLEALARQRYVPPYAMALVYAGLEERDLTFHWLDRAFEAHDVHLIFLTVDPKWDSFRADPRFQSLLARCAFYDDSPQRVILSRNAEAALHNRLN